MKILNFGSINIDHVYRVDLFSLVFKVLLALGFFLVIFLCDDVKGVAPRHHAESYFLLAVCTLAMMLMTSAVHLLALVLALELSSYSLYVLVFLRRDHHLGMVAGLRYFLVGASASAIMLFGLALIYGVTGAVHIDRLIDLLPGMMDHPMVATGLLLTLAEIAALDGPHGKGQELACDISDGESVAGVAKAVLAAAGEHGGRYYTHMRNEGDRLLEAIDEALDIVGAERVFAHSLATHHKAAIFQSLLPQCRGAPGHIGRSRSSGGAVSLRR